MDINYYCQECNYRLRHKRAIREWLREVATEEGNLQIGEINYIFCPSTVHRQMNIDYVGHDYFTDIITFDYCRGKIVRGDMYISLDTVRSNAEMLGESYERELYRVIVHGVLHLCGINDKGPGEREIMERHENEALAMIGL